MTVVLAARVQSHPSRRGLRERLLPGLAGMPVEVIETDFSPPNPWHGYLECLNAPPSGASHVFILQDDTIACRNLTPALEAIATAHPSVPVCVFLGKLPMRTRKAALEAGRRGEHYVQVQLGDFLPVVAVLWPVEKALAFHEWGTRPGTLLRRNGRQTIVDRSDDAMGGRWMRSTRQTVLATIPSLIEHPDDVPSTISKRPANRTALFWHGPHWEATSVDWAL